MQFRVEVAHALGIAAEIVSPVAGQRAHVDTRLPGLILDAHDDVVDESEDERAVFRFDVPGRASAFRRLLGDDAPMQAACRLAHRIEDFVGGAIDDHRLELRKRMGLLGDITCAGISDGIGTPGALTRERGELRGVLGIGRDVVEVRHLEVEGDHARRPCKNRKAHQYACGSAPRPRDAAPPDRDGRADAEQECRDGACECSHKQARGERRIHAAEAMQHQREQDH
jgi:hypothetical protein